MLFRLFIVPSIVGRERAINAARAAASRATPAIFFSRAFSNSCARFSRLSSAADFRAALASADRERASATDCLRAAEAGAATGAFLAAGFRGDGEASDALRPRRAPPRCTVRPRPRGLAAKPSLLMNVRSSGLLYPDPARSFTTSSSVATSTRRSR